MLSNIFLIEPYYLFQMAISTKIILLLILLLIPIMSIYFFILNHKKHVTKNLNDSNEDTMLSFLNEELQDLGFTYDEENDVVFSLPNCWQRDYGYHPSFDEIAAPLNMILDFESIYFEYNDKKWLIEIKKGQYGMNAGAEIGVYSTERTNDTSGTKELSFESNQEDNLFFLSFHLRKEDASLCYREGFHWWLTGFKLGEYSDPDLLYMDIKITFPDKGIRNSFLKAMYQLGYTNDNILFIENSVFFVFHKPYSVQPQTRNTISDRNILKNNQCYCETYQYITKEFPTTLEKLKYLKEHSPALYKSILTINKSNEVFKNINKIQSNMNKISKKDAEKQ